MAAKKRTSDKDEKKKKGPTVLEWAAGAIGAALAIVLLVFISIGAVRPNQDMPPLLSVRPTDIVAGDGSYVVAVVVVNRSAQAAAAVAIEGELRQGGSTVETSSATVSYVPGHSRRRAGLVFSRDPRRFSLETRATGYELP